MMAFTGRDAANAVRALATELGLTPSQVRQVGHRVQDAAERDPVGALTRHVAWVDNDGETVLGLVLPTLCTVWQSRTDAPRDRRQALGCEWYVNVTQQAALEMDRAAEVAR